VKGAVRIPTHRGWERGARGAAVVTTVGGEEPDRFANRPCFEFNTLLPSHLDDAHCTHCRFYLTARCPHIDEFLDDVDDLEPEA
jgi:hypothetical protein